MDVVDIIETLLLLWIAGVQLPKHAQNCDLIRLFLFIQEQHIFTRLDYELRSIFVKWITANRLSLQWHVMNAIASQITSLRSVYSSVCSGSDQRKHQSSTALPSVSEGNSPVIGEFPAQKVSNAENVSIWWRHHAQTPAKDNGTVE